MKIVNIKEIPNPRGFRVFHCPDYPTLFEIRDKDGKRLINEKFINKLRAEEVLAAHLTAKEEKKQSKGK